MSEIAITALGAVTSVGMDAVTTCASIRAGLARPAPLDHVNVLDLEEYKEVPVTGHPAGALGRGFSNVGRWLQLAPVAIADLCASGNLPSPSADRGFWDRTIGVVVLPALGERFLPDPNCDDESIEGAFLAPLRDRVRACFAPSRLSISATGRGGVFDVLNRAGDWMARTPGGRVVVVMVDSLVDTPALEWLLEEGRLKSDENPIGLSPGEAACALLLEDAAAVEQRHSALAGLRAVATGAEAKSYLSGEPSQGESLARVIEQALTEANAGNGAAPLVVADLNGEQWRSHEFGCARARVPRSLWAGDNLMLPVESIGDAGVATPGIQIAVACRALSRGYANSDTALVISSDEQGSVGAAVFSLR